MAYCSFDGLNYFLGKLIQMFAYKHHTHEELATKNYVEEIIAENVSSIGVGKILQQVYPIGAIYISTAKTNPCDIFGFGVWEQIKDVFLLCAGDTYVAGSAGGESEHILTEEEMPVHLHSFDNNVLVNTTSDNGFTVGQATNKQHTIIDSILHTQYAGSNMPHNNMPPYLTVYTWQRIS